MYVRLKFTKGNNVKYISHLDLMRTFMRVVRRAGVPIAYSGGFNPHPEMSFGAPLSLGVTSMAEYVDIKLEKEMPIAETIERLNAHMDEGIRVLGAVELPPKFKSAMALVSHSEYTITAKAENPDVEAVKTQLDSFLKQSSIIAKKPQPKKDFKIKEIDIRPMIIEMSVTGCENGLLCFKCLLQSGSAANLKPELLMQSFEEFAGIKLERMKINRDQVYAEQNGKLIELLQYKD